MNIIHVQTTDTKEIQCFKSISSDNSFGHWMGQVDADCWADLTMLLYLYCARKVLTCPVQYCTEHTLYSTEPFFKEYSRDLYFCFLFYFLKVDFTVQYHTLSNYFLCPVWRMNYSDSHRYMGYQTIIRYYYHGYIRAEATTDRVRARRECKIMATAMGSTFELKNGNQGFGGLVQIEAHMSLREAFCFPTR